MIASLATLNQPKQKKVQPFGQPPQPKPQAQGLLGMSQGMPQYLQPGAQGDLGGDFRTRLENAFFSRKKALLQPELDRQREAAITDYRNRGLSFGSDDFNRQYKEQVINPTNQALQDISTEAILNSGQEFDRYASAVQGQQRLGVDQEIAREQNRLTSRGQDLDFRSATRGQDTNMNIAKMGDATTRLVEGDKLKLGFADLGSRNRIADMNNSTDLARIASGEKVAGMNITSNEKIADLGERSAMERLRENNTFLGGENKAERDSRAALAESQMNFDRFALNRNLDSAAALAEANRNNDLTMLNRRLATDVDINNAQIGNQQKLAQMQQDGALKLEQARQSGDREAAAALFESQKMLQQAKAALDAGNMQLSNQLQIQADDIARKFESREAKRARKSANREAKRVRDFQGSENDKDRSLQSRLAAMARSGGGGGGASGMSDEFIDAWE